MADIVLFGITGDLSRKRLIPALARAWVEGGISPECRFIGYGRKALSNKEFKDFIIKNSPIIEIKKKKIFSDRWTYIESNLEDVRGYKILKSTLNKNNTLNKKAGKIATESTLPKVLIYVSLPPRYQLVVVDNLFKSGALKKGDGKVLAIEKPFGEDSKSAKKFNTFLRRNINEEQIYRIDHYAGKQELINIEKTGMLGNLTITDKKTLKSIEIIFSEKDTINSRGAFYDHVGALNDVGQNHILHILGTILASPYAKSPNYAKIRGKVLNFLKIRGRQTLGQYSSFRSEDEVHKESVTETFFKTNNVLSFGKSDSNPKSPHSINNIEKDLMRRWQGLKITLIAGKALKEDAVSICYKYGKSAKKATSTCIVTSKHGAKDAYQTIFEGILKGNRAHSIDIDQIIASWKYVESVKLSKPKLKIYEVGADPLYII